MCFRSKKKQTFICYQQKLISYLIEKLKLIHDLQKIKKAYSYFVFEKQ